MFFRLDGFGRISPFQYLFAKCVVDGLSRIVNDDQMQDCLNRVIVAVLRLPHFLNQVVENRQILLIIMQFHRAAAVNEDLLGKDQSGNQDKKYD